MSDDVMIKTEIKEEIFHPIDEPELSKLCEETNKISRIEKTQSFQEEITLMKTEIKEEVYDSDPVDDPESYYLKEEEVEIKEEKFDTSDGTDIKNEYFYCRDCGYATNDKSNFQRHFLLHIDQKDFPFNTQEDVPCPFCNKSFNGTTILAQHIRSEHIDYKRYKCERCEYTTANQALLKKHIVEKHTKRGKRHSCEFCHSTLYKSNVVNHMNCHPDIKIFKCEYKNCKCGDDKECDCKICGYATKNKGSLNRHILVKHTEKIAGKKLNAMEDTSTKNEYFYCKECGYATNDKSNFERHFLIHTDEKNFPDDTQEEIPCPFCTISYKGTKSLTQHIHAQHTDYKRYKCDSCEYTTAYQALLKNHQVEKHTILGKTYNCDFCHSSLYKANLLKHMNCHPGIKIFKCTHKNCKCTNEKLCDCKTCGYASRNKSNLEKHILVKHSRKSKEFKCPFCDYAAHVKTQLERHLRTHTGEKLYCCDICGYKFGTRGQLTTHIKLHTRENRFTCTHCEYSSNRMSHLKSHIKRKHALESLPLK